MSSSVTQNRLLCQCYYVLEFHDFSIAHARNRPDTADVAPSLASQASNLRPPIERPNPTFSIVSRNQASGRGSTAVATAFGSSLRSAVLDDFMVKMFHGFPKPQNKFIRDMVYGIQATGDTIITDIARAVAPEDKHRMAVACKSGARKTVPLDLKIWSSLAKGHKGENEEVLDVMRAVDRATDGRGIPLFDFNFRLRLNLHLTHAAIDAHPDLRFFRFEVAVAVPIPAETDLERVRGRERRGEGHRDLSPQVRQERHDDRAFAVDITAWARGG